MNKKVLVIVVLTIILVFAVILGIFFKIKSENNNDIENSNTSTSSYIPNGVNVADENEIGTPANELKFNRSKENVTIKCYKIQ